MKIKQLNELDNSEQDKKLDKKFSAFQSLIEELSQRELPNEIVNSINTSIEKINAFNGESKALRKLIQKEQAAILKQLEKDLKVVSKNHYRNMWMAIGMAAFGIPLGAAFGTVLGNMAYLSLGIPIGMGAGLAIGTGMDQKALEEGRQLDFEVTA